MPSPARRYCPTPWIDNVMHPINQRIYKFRLERTRAGGRIYVTFHKNCPTAPHEQRGVLPSRPQWFEWVEAAERLLESSQWATHTDPNSLHATPEWNKNRRVYATHGDDVNKVAFALPNLLDPKLGPPRKSQRILAMAKPGATTSATHQKARANRYAEITIAMRDVLTRIKSLHERMQDARRMKGYDKIEVAAMLAALEIVKNGADHLRRMAMTNTFRIQREQHVSSNLAPDTPFTVDDLDGDITPLSPQEQQIQVQQERNEFSGQTYHPGTTWMTPEYLRHLGYSEEDIAQSQKTGKERGIIKDDAQWAEVKAAIQAGTPDLPRKRFTIDMTQFKDEVQEAPKPKGGFVVVPDEEK